MEQFTIITAFDVCKIMIDKGLPLSVDICQLLTAEEKEHLMHNDKVERSAKLSPAISKPVEGQASSLFLLEKLYPILFRGSHLAELNPTINLSEIQGRPEDDSYDGNIIHLTSSLHTALCYAKDNADRPFPDKRTAVMIYDTAALNQYGTFGKGGHSPPTLDGAVLHLALIL